MTGGLTAGGMTQESQEGLTQPRLGGIMADRQPYSLILEESLGQAKKEEAPEGTSEQKRLPPNVM